jgi:hypothetical protein
MTNKITPEMMCNYKLALTLHKTFNNQYSCDEWLYINFNQLVNSKKLMFKTSNTNKGAVVAERSSELTLIA